MNRRQFVYAMSAAALAASRAAGAKDKPPKPLRILVLGGTKFLGVHIVELALKHGHTVTLFNRGKTNADLFPQLEHLKGDRDAQLDSLKGRRWDAVIDDSGYVPRHVKLSAELLAPNVQRYVFVSTISVYASFAQPNTEDSPVGKLADETTEKVDGGAYGPLKALCEKAAETAMPGRVAVVRPGLIVGPRDPTDRFTYWPARAARGGEMLAPDRPNDRIQFIDARDLAAFMLHLVDRQTVGIFNAASPPGMFRIGDLISASSAAAGTLAKPVAPPRALWVPADFLEKQQVQPWSDMPVWTPESGEYAGLPATSVARALHEGLIIRPIQPTVNDTLTWHLQRPEQERAKLLAGLTPEREQAILAAWHAASDRAH
ncbi:MAG TPA: NAD-dependent epimerase/dehydratase family protein [Steroidobacteraceae bacterium]|jgi:2'-hydroxyisoflavone reductase|nr:NAD-dependent epimerase/dehydratase family protein [Steroidobacteraceae bacterium]